MVGRRKIILVLIGTLSLCAAVHADMVPLSPVAAGYQQLLQARTPTDPRLTSSFSPFVGFAGIADLGSLPVGFLPQPNAEAGQTSETKPAQILTDRQNSLSLCLYTLLGLGLCRSAPLVKKLHFDCIPDWYHTGGPFQIRHSLAMSPDCLCSAPVYCFIQPDGTAEDCLPQYYRGTIASLLRKSRFIPTALASRGPPCLS